MLLFSVRLVRPYWKWLVVVTAAMLAQAHEFIVALPDGYDTIVGEGRPAPLGRTEAAARDRAS